MNRRVLFALLAAFLLAPFAYADVSQLKAAEIRSLLSGKTITGDWGGPYEQVFYEDGRTLYIPQGQAGDNGRWRVNENNETYESWWENTGWTAYRIGRDGDALFWLDHEDKQHPFVIVD